MNTMRQVNRDGGEYIFDSVSENVFELVATNERMIWCMSYCRFGGKEGAESIDYSDLGFIDPAGGPFISPGFPIPISSKKVKKIRIDKYGDNERILFEVE
ncbi:hypothetical protein UFOVP116_223 [uncultured Caudovirales phage]|uniref:Uncharacterized protein n=1 Tax=uncultured Caudovirales phage TaxID=2100421 RepID=A0A6J5LA96_9CAUD|nr:hypothetical protein UFOVP116_223 [uncultured Caudovirales phage]